MPFVGIIQVLPSTRFMILFGEIDLYNVYIQTEMMFAPQLPKMLLKNPIFYGSFEAPSRFEHTKGLPHHPHQCQPTWHHQAQIPQRRNHLRCDFSAAGCFWCFSVSLTPPGNSTIQSRTILKKKTACSLCKRNSRHTHLFTHKKNGFVFTTQHRWNENVLQVVSLYACDHFKKDLHECCFPFQ